MLLGNEHEQNLMCFLMFCHAHIENQMWQQNPFKITLLILPSKQEADIPW